MNRAYRYIAAILFTGCVATQRDCASCSAENFGADWVVVQFDLNGRVFRCWELHEAGIKNEEGSDGIWWQDPTSHNLVHLSGLYNRVQVVNGQWDAAFHAMGVTRDRCTVVRGIELNSVADSVDGGGPNP